MHYEISLPGRTLPSRPLTKGGILWICIPLIIIKCVWNKNWYKKLTIAECALWPVIPMFWLVGFLFKTDLGIHLNFTSTGGLFLHVSWKAQNVIQTPWSTHCIWKLMPHGECKLVYRFHFTTLCNYYCILFTRFDTSIKKCLGINLNGCLIGSFTWQIWQTMVGISVMFFVCPPCCRGTQCMLCITVTCHPSTVPGMSGSCAALPPLHTCADSLWVRVPSPMMLYPHDCCSTDPFTSRCMRGLTLLSACVSQAVASVALRWCYTHAWWGSFTPHLGSVVICAVFSAQPVHDT